MTRKKSAQGALNRFKMEVANELGIQDYENIDKETSAPVKTVMLAVI